MKLLDILVFLLALSVAAGSAADDDPTYQNWQEVIDGLILNGDVEFTPIGFGVTPDLYCGPNEICNPLKPKPSPCPFGPDRCGGIISKYLTTPAEVQAGQGLEWVNPGAFAYSGIGVKDMAEIALLEGVEPRLPIATFRSSNCGPNQMINGICDPIVPRLNPCPNLLSGCSKAPVPLTAVVPETSDLFGVHSEDSNDPETSNLSLSASELTWSSVALLGGNGKAYCSGALVSSNLAITAAHCTCGETFNTEPHNILLGPKIGHPHSIIFTVSEAYRFEPKFCDTDNRQGLLDLALISVEPVEGFQAEQFLASLSFTEGPASGPALLAGFGLASDDFEGGVREAFIFDEVLECTAEAAFDVLCVQGLEFFTKLPPGEVGGGCHVDSGGPLFNEQGELFGVKLRGIYRQTTHKKSCGGGDIYADLGSYHKNEYGLNVREWIVNAIQ